MAQTFDVVVIGGGPGGSVAAIRRAQLGLKTACIDDWKTPDGKPALGGTCTNIGCIPSQALLQSSENFEQAGHHFADHGVRVKGLELDLVQMLKRKDQLVKASNDGVVYLFKKNKVAFFHGRGSFTKAGADGCEIAVAGAQNETLTAKNVIVATGSVPRALSGAAFDEKLILSNDGALAIPEVPKRLGVIGAGVIGLEVGSVWRRLGSEVTILEALPVFLGAADEQIAREAWKVFTKQGLKIELGVKIAGVKAKKDVTVEYADAEGKAQSAIFDRLIVSIGRIANTEGLNAGGVAYRAGTFPFMANARARALGDTSGLVKFLADANTDAVLGVHIIGAFASELIAEAVVAMEFRASSEDIGMICHAHPSLSEAMKDAALAVDKRALNI